MSLTGKFSFSFLGVLLIAFILNTYWNRNSPIITLNSNGQLQGRIAQSRDGRVYYEYLGIPFAEPPVGDRRFKSPKPAKPWKGVRNAKNYGSACIQVDIVTNLEMGKEDCLYLNVYVPKVDHKRPLPILVFVHGGYYVIGSGDIYGAKYLMDRDVILVVINYRLGAFGFLNAGNKLSRGNMGLKDQVMALKWIQENIESFGGNKNKVTIWGQSAGAVCVHFLLLSRMSKGLFHGAISHSGTVLSPWGMTHRPKEQAERFAKKLNCSRKTSKEMVECLIALPASDINEITREIFDALHEPLAIFKPSIESINDGDAFLAEHPYAIMQENRIPNRVPWIIGANKDDGLAVTSVIVRRKNVLEMLEKDWQQLLPLFMLYKTRDKTTHDKIRKYYFGNDKKFANFTNLDKFIKMFSDRYYFSGIHQSGFYHAKSAPVFGYVFSQPNDISFANLLLSVGERFHPMIYLATEVATFWIRKLIFGTKPTFYGVAHFDEMTFLLNVPTWPQFSQSSENYVFSVQFVKLWASFAENGIPQSIDGLKWPHISHEDYPKPIFLNICNKSSLVQDPFGSAAQFWDSLNIVDR